MSTDEETPTARTETIGHIEMTFEEHARLSDQERRHAWWAFGGLTCES